MKLTIQYSGIKSVMEMIRRFFAVSYIISILLFCLSTTASGEVIYLGSAGGSEKANIEQLLSDWSTAWERGDINLYMSFYDKSFFSRYKKMDYNQWRNYKAGIFKKTKYAKVEIINPEIKIEGDMSVVEFRQRYVADNYRDTGNKTLILRRTSGGWKISGEEFIQTGR